MDSVALACGILLDQGLAGGLSFTVPLGKSQAPSLQYGFQPLDLVGCETQPHTHYEVCEKKAERKASRKARERSLESFPFFLLCFLEMCSQADL